MRIVHCANERFGSFNWELPPRVAAILEQAPPEVRKDIVRALESNIQGLLLVLGASVKMGPQTNDAFDILSKHQTNMTMELKKLMSININDINRS